MTPKTILAKSFFNRLGRAMRGEFKQLDLASPGDLVGIRLFVQSDPSGFINPWPAQEYITANADGGYNYVRYVDLPDRLRPAAAMASMDILTHSPAHSNEAYQAYDILRDANKERHISKEGAVYELVILRAMAICMLQQDDQGQSLQAMFQEGRSDVALRKYCVLLVSKPETAHDLIYALKLFSDVQRYKRVFNTAMNHSLEKCDSARMSLSHITSTLEQAFS